jgi:hypothetical protein
MCVRVQEKEHDLYRVMIDTHDHSLWRGAVYDDVLYVIDRDEEAWVEERESFLFAESQDMLAAMADEAQ